MIVVRAEGGEETCLIDYTTWFRNIARATTVWLVLRKRWSGGVVECEQHQQCVAILLVECG
jgi:hypothetical protein